MRRLATHALRYKTWNDYCVKEFGNQHIAIPREDRDEVIGSLRSAGLSVRAISDATGLGRGTVRRSITANTQAENSTVPNGTVENHAAGVPNGTPENTGEDAPGLTKAPQKHLNPTKNEP
ncbi:hypothetical protein [Glutamicibacter sp. AOP5-A2-18]|uniref:hypothetical protein n=1 Tax=Glutamicibacter sp. AOP5-A2-18 TaxID=3457656 RepID=UPI004033FB82